MSKQTIDIDVLKNRMHTRARSWTITGRNAVQSIKLLAFPLINFLFTWKQENAYDSLKHIYQCAKFLEIPTTDLGEVAILNLIFTVAGFRFLGAILLLLC